MADVWELSGSYATRPLLGNPSAAPSLITPLDEALQLGNKSIKFFELQAVSPTPTSVPFDFPNVHVLVVKAVGGHVRVRVTSADGSQQAIPVGGLLVLTSTLVPITAVDLLQDAGLLVQVQLFLGALAT